MDKVLNDRTYHLFAYFLKEKPEFNGKDIGDVTLAVIDIPMFHKFLCKYEKGKLEIKKSESVNLAKILGLDEKKVCEPSFWERISALVDKKELHNVPITSTSGVKIGDILKILKKLMHAENKTIKKYLVFSPLLHIKNLISKFGLSGDDSLFYFEGNLERFVKEGKEYLNDVYVFGKVPADVELVIYKFEQGKINGCRQTLVSKGENTYTFIEPIVKLENLRLAFPRVSLFIDDREISVFLPEREFKNKPMDGWSVGVVFRVEKRRLDGFLKNGETFFPIFSLEV